jgi:phosphoglycerate dehydrogenase-like enzyme
MSYKLLLYRDEAYPDSHIADRYPAALKKMLPDVEVVLARTRAEADAHIASADAAFGNLPPDLFAQAKRLRWIQGPQAGPDPSFYHPAMVASDVVVTNMRGIFNDHISAHILAMMLAFARGLPRYLRSSRDASGPPARPRSICPSARSRSSASAASVPRRHDCVPSSGCA